jgi:SAM-dependent methyltransferase
MPPREPSAGTSGAVGRRKLLGAWYTPEPLLEHVVAITLPDSFLAGSTGTLSVLDPACGDGRFLRAVAASAARHGRAVRLVGVDVDRAAVAAARESVPDAEIVHADALERDWDGEVFDVVIGNPPFLNQMSAATTRGGRSRFGGGPYADAAAEFLAMAVRLVRRDGGRVGFVLPQSVVSTRDAAPIRADVLSRGAVVHAWWSNDAMFDAAVRTCALVIEVGRTAATIDRTFGDGFEPAPPISAQAVADGAWGALLLDDVEHLPAADGDTLGLIATFAVDFRDQYYGLVGAVGDDVDGPPLITSGLIEPGRCLWGERPVRFAKQRYERPRVDVARLTPRMQEWVRRRLVPKLLIANQTRTIEVVHDVDGAWLPSVPVITCTTAAPDRVAAVLADDRAVRWVRQRAAGTGLSPHTVRLTPALLAAVPLP